jgi:hypothetical protein
VKPDFSRSQSTVRFRRVAVAAAFAAAAVNASGTGATDWSIVRGSRIPITAAPPVLRPLGRLEIRLAGVSSISADGGAVAVAAEHPGECGKVVLWSPKGRRMSTIRAGCYGKGGFNGISDLVLGRRVVAWVFRWGDGSSGADCLMIHHVATARIGRAITRKGHACNVDYYGDFYGITGRRVPAFQSVANGGTRGAAGDLLTSLQTTAAGIVYSIENYCNADCSAPPSTAVPRHVKRSYLVSPAGAETLLAGPGVRIVAGGGMVAAALRLNSLDVLDLSTHAWRTLADGPVRGAHVDGNNLFVLRSKGLLETYDLRMPGSIATQQQLGNANTAIQLEDADGAFVVYVSNRQIRVRRTRDGKELLVALPRNTRGPLHAEIETTGLYYAYNVRGTGAAAGRVGFIARSRLARTFGT